MHQVKFWNRMMTSSNGNIFRVTGHLCGEFPRQRPVARNFDVFFHLRLNKQLSKQSWGWWFETLARPQWRHCNGTTLTINHRVCPITICMAMLCCVLLWLYNQISVNMWNTMTSSNGNIYRVTGHVCWEFIGQRWIPQTKASGAELWCFLSSASE